MDAGSFTLADGRSLGSREAHQRDASALLRFSPDAFDETDCLIMTRQEFDKTLSKEADFLGKIAASTTQLALVGHAEDKLVGMLTFTGRDLERVRHTGEIGLIVGKDHWGLEIGRCMMHVLHQWAEANPLVTKIDLRVRLANQRAINLYEHMGYQIEGWIRRAVKIGDEYDDHYWMGFQVPGKD